MNYTTQTSEDGTIKITYKEGYHSVIIPSSSLLRKTLHSQNNQKITNANCEQTKDNKHALCVSCQIGCPIGCKFCFSGKFFKRNLKAKEIIEEFENAKTILGKNPDTIVFMGQGEPTLNLKEVIEAANYFHTYPIQIGYNHITISTSCPNKKAISKLINQPFAIAISLHSPFDSKRKELTKSQTKIKDIVEFANKCVEARNKRTILIQYTLIKGINDSDKDLKKLVSLNWPKNTMFNLIEFNENKDYKSSDQEAFLKFREKIIQSGWKCFTRQARGKDIEAACGMLS